MTPDDIDNTLATVAESPSSDGILEVIGKLDFMSEQIKELRKKLEPVAIAWIDEHGPLVRGTVRYYVGEKSETKCKDVAKALQMFLESLGMDETALLLASGAWKHGAARKAVDKDVYEALFETNVRRKLEGGAELMKIDDRFLK